MEKFRIPKNIEKQAKDYMKALLKTLEDRDMLENVDSAALEMLAYNYSTFIKACKIIEKEGLTITSDRGNISEHPAVKIGKDAQIQAMKLMVEFGLTTKSRMKLNVVPQAEEDSELEEFMKQNEL